jgi:hypothetical protein
MATTKQAKPDWLKAKVRTSRMTMDIDGPLKSALPDMIYMLDSKGRESVIAKMQKIHADICLREAEQDSAPQAA